MALAWFICPYKRGTLGPGPSRYCAMDDFTAQIKLDGGVWSETEILGDRAIVKVRASAPTLSFIANTPGFRRIPLTLLNEPLSSLTQVQRTAIRNEVLDAGYTLEEVNARFPDILNNTLGDVLRFLASRRLKPRHDRNTDSIVLDGSVQPCKDVDLLDREVN